MFTKSKDTTSALPKRKFMVFAALAGTACVALGLCGLSVSTESELRLDALEAYTTHLSDHRDYVENQGKIVEHLMGQGVNNMLKTALSVAQLADAA